MRKIVRRIDEGNSLAGIALTPRRVTIHNAAPVLLLMLSLAGALPAHGCSYGPILRGRLDAANSVVVTGVVRVLDRTELHEGANTIINGHIRLKKPRIERRSIRPVRPIVFPFASSEHEGCVSGYLALDGRKVRAYLQASQIRPNELELVHLEYLDL